MSLFDYASEKLINELEKSKSPMLSVSMGMEPVMPMAQGGGLSTVQNSLNINGEPHRLAYINPSEESLLQQLGGSGRKIDGIPSYYSTDAEADESNTAANVAGMDSDPSSAEEGIGIGFDTSPAEAEAAVNAAQAEEAAVAAAIGEAEAYSDTSNQAVGLGFGTQNPDTYEQPPNLGFFDQLKNRARTFGRDPDDVLDLIFAPVLPIKGLRGVASLVGKGLSKAGLAGPDQTADEAVAEQEASLDDVGGTGDDIIIREKIAAVKNVPVEEVTVEEVERAKRLTAAQRVTGTRLEDILDDIYGSGKGAGLLGITTNNTGTA